MLVADPAVGGAFAATTALARVVDARSYDGGVRPPNGAAPLESGAAVGSIRAGGSSQAALRRRR